LAYVLPLALLSARVGSPWPDATGNCPIRMVESNAVQGNPRPEGPEYPFYGSRAEVVYHDYRVR